MLSRANGATYTSVSRVGGVQTFSGCFVQARTVAIRRRGQRVRYSWYDGHRGPEQQSLRFTSHVCVRFKLRIEINPYGTKARKP